MEQQISPLHSQSQVRLLLLINLSDKILNYLAIALRQKCPNMEYFLEILWYGSNEFERFEIMTVTV